MRHSGTFYNDLPLSSSMRKVLVFICHTLYKSVHHHHTRKVVVKRNKLSDLFYDFTKQTTKQCYQLAQISEMGPNWVKVAKPSLFHYVRLPLSKIQILKYYIFGP